MSDLVWVRIDGYRILGTSIRFQSQDADVAEMIGRMWRAFAVDSRAARSLDTFSLSVEPDRMVLFHDCVQVARLHDLDHAVRVISTEMNRHVIDRYAGLGVHAGVVGTGNKVAVFPGASGTGKTTLVAAAARTGFDYVSDEGLCLDLQSDRVIPYPKPLGLGAWIAERIGIESRGTEVVADPGAFSPMSVEQRPRVAHVVAFERRPGPPRLTPGVRSRTVGLLLENSFNHYKNPEAAFRTVSRIASYAEAWLLEYEDAFDAAELLSGRLK